MSRLTSASAECAESVTAVVEQQLADAEADAARRRLLIEQKRRVAADVVDLLCDAAPPTVLRIDADVECVVVVGAVSGTSEVEGTRLQLLSTRSFVVRERLCFALELKNGSHDRLVANFRVVAITIGSLNCSPLRSRLMSTQLVEPIAELQSGKRAVCVVDVPLPPRSNGTQRVVIEASWKCSPTNSHSTSMLRPLTSDCRVRTAVIAQLDVNWHDVVHLDSLSEALRQAEGPTVLAALQRRVDVEATGDAAAVQSLPAVLAAVNELQLAPASGRAHLLISRHRHWPTLWLCCAPRLDRRAARLSVFDWSDANVAAFVERLKQSVGNGLVFGDGVIAAARSDVNHEDNIEHTVELTTRRYKNNRQERGADSELSVCIEILAATMST